MLVSLVLVGAGIGLKAIHDHASAGMFQRSHLWTAGPVPGLFGVQISHQLELFQICLRKFIDAFPSLLMLVIVIGGIVAGFFTATEASAVAVLYALILALIYKEITLRTCLPLS